MYYLPAVYSLDKDLRPYVMDVDSVIEVCDWGHKYSVYKRLDKDVNDPLYRSIVGFYQISDVIRNRSLKRYFKEELSEAIASFLFHNICAIEMTEIVKKIDITLIEKYDIFSFSEFNEYAIKEKRTIEDFLKHYAGYEKQLLYYCMNRENRFDPIKMIDELIESFICILYYNKDRNWDIKNGLALCMSKLQDAGLQSH
jgi:hypothetical protein